jgi:hypothetical protein
MRPTRILCSINDRLRMEASPKLLLPMPSLLERLGSAMQGVWSSVVDEQSREAFEAATEDKVINNDVLMNANNGSVLSFALFHNLQNPLWSDYSFDSKQFLNAVGPALENFFDTTETLRNQTRASEEEKKNLDEIEKQSETELKVDISGDMTSLSEALLGTNQWRKRAETDPQSLEGQLWKMSTPQSFSASYYVTKFGLLGMLLDPERKVYEEGSCRVGGVALLDARVMIVEDKNKEIGEHEEFEASETLKKDIPVAAQIDVLCEVSYTFSTAKHANSPDDKETVTDLAVAVFEGWLNGGPEKQLRWRVAMLRSAYEFPYTAQASH